MVWVYYKTGIWGRCRVRSIQRKKITGRIGVWMMGDADGRMVYIGVMERGGNLSPRPVSLRKRIIAQFYPLRQIILHKHAHCTFTSYITKLLVERRRRTQNCKHQISSGGKGDQRRNICCSETPQHNELRHSRITLPGETDLRSISYSLIPRVLSH